MNADPRRWDGAAEEILAALVTLLGRPGGKRGRSMSAYRQAARRLADQGVSAGSLDTLLIDFAVAHLEALGPMPLASYVDGRLKVTDARFVGTQRWPTECATCEREIGRGEMVWLRRAEDSWLVTCETCEPLDHGSERARSARAKALERDDDAEGLLARILEFTPSEFREAVEDDLAMLVAVMAEET